MVLKITKLPAIGTVTAHKENVNVETLQKILGPENVLTQKEDLIPYSFDGTAALESQLPLAVVLPKDSRQISEVVKIARSEKVSIVTRGSGTGLSGGSIPVSRSIVLCTAKMDSILEVDERNLTLLAEAGAVTQQIAAAAERVGLFYPPDPGSGKISSIGGNVAENSGGLRGLKYGVTRDYVMGMEVVLPDGQIIWLGNKCVKDVAGYSMKDVFIGSEGTLGIITKVLLKLIPKPASRKTLLATYGSMEHAAETVSAIIAAKITPCTLEFLDQTTIHCVEDFSHIGLPLDVAAILLMETDGHPAAVEEEIHVMSELARQHQAISVQIAKDEEESNRLAAARRSAFSALARVSPTTILEDATVPRSELAKMILRVQEIARRHKLKIGVFGHMGDGNLHPTFLTNEKNVEEMDRVEKAMVEIFDYAIELGGTITGEHGVGIAKKPFLAKALGNGSLELMRTLKRALDPENILNPGKIFSV